VSWWWLRRAGRLVLRQVVGAIVGAAPAGMASSGGWRQVVGADLAWTISPTTLLGSLVLPVHALAGATNSVRQRRVPDIEAPQGGVPRRSAMSAGCDSACGLSPLFGISAAVATLFKP